MQIARNFRKSIYLLTAKLPKEKTFGLISQIRRSVSSIGACLAERSGKITQKDKAHYTNLACTTTLQILNYIIAAMDLVYITEEEYLICRSKIENITIKLSGLILSLIPLNTNLSSLNIVEYCHKSRKP